MSEQNGEEEMNETKQSDGPYFAYECGCTMGYISIDYCPKHKAAPEMYEALRATTGLLDSIVPAGDELDEPIEKAISSARAALAKAEGKP